MLKLSGFPVVKQPDEMKKPVITYIVSLYPNSSGSTSSGQIKVDEIMILAKPHLLPAFQEIEILKEKVAELKDKICHLEMENAILKASASYETLSQLETQALPSDPELEVSNPCKEIPVLAKELCPGGNL